MVGSFLRHIIEWLVLFIKACLFGIVFSLISGMEFWLAGLFSLMGIFILDGIKIARSRKTVYTRYRTHP